jgi:hypothetical protein
MGWQGWLIIAIITLGSALFAATRKDWTSMLISAIILPLIMFAIISLLSRAWRGRTQLPERSRESSRNVDLMTFLARTNPVMFLILGALDRGADDERYQELLRSGPFGLGPWGYLAVVLLVLTPLILTLIIVAVTGQLPAHSGPSFP